MNVFFDNFLSNQIRNELLSRGKLTFRPIVLDLKHVFIVNRQLSTDLIYNNYSMSPSWI